MKRTFLALGIFTLLGCQTAGQATNVAKSPTTALSCPQIQAAFNAFEQDKSSLNAWVEVVKAVNPQIDPYAAIADKTTDERVQQAKLYANIALAVQGCQPLQ